MGDNPQRRRWLDCFRTLQRTHRWQLVIVRERLAIAALAARERRRQNRRAMLYRRPADADTVQTYRRSR